MLNFFENKKINWNLFVVGIISFLFFIFYKPLPIYDWEKFGMVLFLGWYLIFISLFMIILSFEKKED